MTPQSKAALCLCVSSLLATVSAFAQEPPPDFAAQAPAGDEQILYDPTQFPSVTGRVQQFTLTPRGEIDGLILSDGTEVKTPPPLSTSLGFAIKPGDTVTVHGLRAAGIPLIRAFSVTDRTSGKTLMTDEVARGPNRGGRPPRPNQPIGNGLAEAQGFIRMSLHGARGEVNGVLLKDGTVVRFAPQAAVDFASLLQPGKTVFVQGEEMSNGVGRVLEVRRIGPSREQLSTLVAPPPPPPPRSGPAARGGPIDDAGPPPPPPPANPR